MIPIGETKDGRADMTNFEMDLFDTRMSTAMDKEESEECCKNSIVKPACLPITILALLLLMTFFIPLFNDDSIENVKNMRKLVYAPMNAGKDTQINSTKILFNITYFRLEIVESIPTGMVYPGFQNNTSTFQAWTELLKSAEKSIDLAVLYWDLRDSTGYPTAWQGRETFNNMVEAAKRDRFQYLEDHDYAEVRSLNFSSLLGSGVLHTKMWIIDQKDVYLGSANMDWKSLTEVKELGVLIRNCSCIASDIGKYFLSFSIYWRMGEQGAKIPYRWPINLRTNFNSKNMLDINFNVRDNLQASVSHAVSRQQNPPASTNDVVTINSIPSKAFISSSPAAFNPKVENMTLMP
uniref:PLD phosphodiesterase domain-containing protein n=1 Tax=Ditylenchus dipsaci TaxID=166011 RepID=A0A915DQ10_9BILA